MSLALLRRWRERSLGLTCHLKTLVAGARVREWEGLEIGPQIRHQSPFADVCGISNSMANRSAPQAHAGSLDATLRIGRLVFGGVGHRNRRAIEHLHGSPQPAPRLQCRSIRHISCMASEPCQQGFGKTLSGTGIGPGVGRARRNSLPQSPGEKSLDCRGQGRIGVNHLAEEQPQHSDGIAERVVALQAHSLQRTDATI